MLGLLRFLKRRLITWLADSLAEHETRQAQSTSWGTEQMLIVAATAQLGPEAKVENYAQDRTKIQIGANSYVRGRLVVSPAGGQITIGEWCYVGHRSEIFSLCSITIGNRVLIAHDVNIVDNTAHSLNSIERHNHFRHTLTYGRPKTLEELPGVRFAPVIIEDDVWLSFGVTVHKGVRIGAGSVIAANSIVTKDVPPGVLYRGKIEPILTSLSEKSPQERDSEG